MTEGTGQETPPASGARLDSIDSGQAPSQTPFLETLPEELRANPSMTKFKDVGALAKSYIELQSKAGSDPEYLLKLPKDGAIGDEVFNKLGRPEAADKYSVPQVEGFSFNDDFVGQARQSLHKSGLSDKQFQDVLTMLANDQINSAKEATLRRNEYVEGENQKITTAWGDSIELNKQNVKIALDKFGGANLEEVLTRTGAIESAVVVDMLAKVGNSLREHGAINTDAMGGSGGIYTKDEAINKINELRNDKKYMEDYNSGDAAKRKEMETLYKYAYPPQKAS